MQAIVEMTKSLHIHLSLTFHLVTRHDLAHSKRPLLGQTSYIIPSSINNTPSFSTNHPFLSQLMSSPRYRQFGTICCTRTFYKSTQSWQSCARQQSRNKNMRTTLTIKVSNWQTLNAFNVGPSASILHTFAMKCVAFQHNL